MRGVNLITINRGRWESLTPEQRKIILEVGKEAGAWEAQAMKDGDVEFKQELVSKGMKVVKFSDDDRNKWKNSPAVKKIAQGLGGANGKRRAFPENACSPCTRLTEHFTPAPGPDSWTSAYSIIWTAVPCR